MPVSKVGRSLKPEPGLAIEVPEVFSIAVDDGSPIAQMLQPPPPIAPIDPIDPIAEVFQADITRLAQHFWLSVVPTQLGPAIQQWINQPDNRTKFSKTLSGIGFCDFFEGPVSDSDGPLAMAAIETPALPMEDPTP